MESFLLRLEWRKSQDNELETHVIQRRMREVKHEQEHPEFLKQPLNLEQRDVDIVSEIRRGTLWNGQSLL